MKHGLNTDGVTARQEPRIATVRRTGRAPVLRSSPATEGGKLPLSPIFGPGPSHVHPCFLRVPSVAATSDSARLAFALANSILLLLGLAWLRRHCHQSRYFAIA